MRRKRGVKRGRALSIVVAAGVGFLLGSWSASAVRGSSPSPAQTVALRFPEDVNAAPAAEPVAARFAATVTGTVMADAQLALFDPRPMVPRAAPPQAPVQLATAEGGGPLPASVAAPQVQVPVPLPEPQAAREPRPRAPSSAPRPRPEIAVQHVKHPGYMLDDAQIAGIRQRLHLSPDQERMWPAVASALHNIGFARLREAHRHGYTGAALANGGIDPDSAEVQNLKSAAIPLIMSFNEQQKDEVRNLAHSMGLDRLASQF